MSPGDWTYEDDFISHVQSEQLAARRRELSTASLIREVLAELPPSSVQRDPYLTLMQLSRYSGLSKRQLYRLLDDPIDPLPYYRVGKLIRVKQADFDRWMRTPEAAGADLDQLVREVAKEA